MGVVATMNFRNTNTINIQNMVADLLEQHPNSTFIPERNRAQSLIDHLLIELPRRGIDPFKRIYNTLVDDQTTRRTEFMELVNTPLGARTQEFYDSKRTCFGFWTGSQSRPILYGRILQECAKHTGYVTRDKELIDQIMGLVAKNGRVDHKSGGHDDLVIAWLLGYWFITDARHHDWYGIDTRKVMAVTEQAQGYSIEEQAWLDYQARMRDELNTVMDQLKAATNPMIVSRLEQQLRNLKAQIVDMGNDAMTVDQLLLEAKEARQLKSRIGRQTTPPQNIGARPKTRRYHQVFY